MRERVDIIQIVEHTHINIERENRMNRTEVNENTRELNEPVMELYCY